PDSRCTPKWPSGFGGREFRYPSFNKGDAVSEAIGGCREEQGETIGSFIERMGVTSTVAGGVAESSQPQSDPLDQLKKLAELRDSDAITPAEYEEHKRKLLAKLA